MKYEDYRITNGAAAQELLEDPGFIQAFRTAMDILGGLFLYHPVRDSAGARALATLRAIDVAPDWPFGTDDARGEAARLLDSGLAEDETRLERAFTVLFRGPGKLPAAIWGSVYLDHEHVTYGESWVALRSWMRTHGIEKTYDEREPEDQVGRMMILAGELAAEKPQDLCEFLGEHFLPWAYRFLELFEPAARAESPTYGAIAALARATLEDVQGLLTLTPARYKLYR